MYRSALLLSALLAGVPLFASATGPTGPAASSSAAPASSSVVVRQGSATLTLGDIDAYAATLPDDMRAGIFYSADRIQRILDQLLQTRQLANEARASGLADDPLVKHEMKLAADKALAEAQRKSLRKKFEQAVPDQTALAHERYLAKPESFVTPKKVDVKHILISTDKHTDAKAKMLAEKLLTQLRADPGKFADYVEKYSDDKSKSRNHGLIRHANSKRLAVPFREASEKLDHAGEIVGPVKTSYGYHIIKAVKITPEHQQSFDEVRPDLVKKMRERWVDQQVAEHLGDLRGADIEMNDQLVRSLLKRYQPPGETGEPPAPKPRIQHMSATD